MARFLSLISLILFFSLHHLSAQPKSYTASRAGLSLPVIDGRIEDAAWRDIPWAGDFMQRQPYDDRKPSQQTAFKIIYNDEYLYVAYRCYDSLPGKIMKRLSRRDQADGDWVGIIFDSYEDKQTGFALGITAAGVKFDVLVANNENDDETWDAVFDAKANIDDKGWTSEMRIPLSQLRFADKENHSWGLQVMRNIFRNQEQSQWQDIKRDAPNFISQFGSLIIRGIKPRKDMEITPYTLAKLETDTKQEGNPYKSGKNTSATAGIDGKIAVTSDLTMNFTVNPDFGQVEADPSQVNLSAFETFFTEKRPFFIEGKKIFNFKLTGGDGDITSNNIFYSRRIGRAPSFSPSLRDNEYADIPPITSILGSFKLSGKSKKGLSVGIMESLTQNTKAGISYLGEERKVSVEPMTNFFVGRIQKEYDKGITQLGGVFTATNRFINDDNLKFLPASSYIGGVDFARYSKNRVYSIKFKGLVSNVSGTREAITRLQRYSTHFYQRPDQGYVRLDSSRTSLSGFGGTIEASKSGNGKWNFMGWVTMRSPGLDMNDVGYMRQADEIQQVFWAGYRINNPFSIFRYLNVNFNEFMGWTFGGESTYKGANVNVNTQFKNYLSIGFGTEHDLSSFSTSELRGGPALRYPGSQTVWGFIESDSRKKFTVDFNPQFGWSADRASRSSNYSFSFTYKPTNSVSVSLSPSYSKQFSELQYLSTINWQGQDRYIMADLDQQTFALSMRCELNLTPEFSIQYYGQPFLFAGDYSGFKRITDPKAKQFSNRFSMFSNSQISYDSENTKYNVDENVDHITDYTFSNPDFHFLQFRSNLVARWEYKPGSTFYLVWTQGRTGYDTAGDFRMRQYTNDLFNVFPQNIFLLKFSYLFTL